MDKIYELLLDKIDKKLSVRAFLCVIGILAVAILDYDKKILLESISTIKFLVISSVVIGLIYLLVVKRSVKEFIYEQDSREYENDNYTINCSKYEITINHIKSRVLWGGNPEIKFKIRNKTDEIIENLEGYIDLFSRDTCIIHEKIKIDYILPDLAREEMLLDNELAYRSWETAKFVLVENEGKIKVFSGDIRSSIPDIEYLLIKNKTWHVVKEKLRKPVPMINWLWNGGRHKIGKKRDNIIRKIKKIIYRILMIACGVIIIAVILLWMYMLGHEIYKWIILHVNTYLE